MTCQEFVVCTEMGHQLNEETNTCEKMHGKTKYGIAMIMLMIIFGGTLYAIIDDKHCCMEPNRTQLGAHEQYLNGSGLRVEDAEPNPQTEEEEQLFARQI